MMAKKMLGVRLEENLIAALKISAVKKKTSVQAIVEQLIVSYLRKEKEI